MAAPSDQPSFDYLFKVLLVGDSGVGKSSLLLRFTSNEFDEASVPTIGKMNLTTPMSSGMLLLSRCFGPRRSSRDGTEALEISGRPGGRELSPRKRGRPSETARRDGKKRSRRKRRRRNFDAAIHRAPNGGRRRKEKKKKTLTLSATEPTKPNPPPQGVDFRLKFLDLQGKRLKLTVWDTAGQERFRTLTSSYYRGAHAVVFAYDVTRRETFDALEDVWMREVQLYSTVDAAARMVVGNKVDRAGGGRRWGRAGGQPGRGRGVCAEARLPLCRDVGEARAGRLRRLRGADAKSVGHSRAAGDGSEREDAFGWGRRCGGGGGGGGG